MFSHVYISYHTVGYILLFPWFSLSGWYIPITHYIFPWNSPYIPTHSQKHIPIVHIIYIFIFPSYSITFPLCFRYIPIILCPLHYVTSMILSIPTILQLIMYYIYIYIYIFPYDCHDIPIVSYYILLYIHILNSLYNWIIVSLCSKHIPMIYPRFSPFQGPWSSASLWTAPRLAETSFPSRTCRWSCDVMVILPTGFSVIEKWDLRVSIRWFKGIYTMVV